MRLFSLILLLLFCQSTSGFATSGNSFHGRTTFRRNGNVLKSGPGEEGGMKENLSITSDNGLSTGPASVFGNPISAETKKFNKAMIDFIKGTVFDTFYKNQDDDRQRDYARFYALETIARTPYFAYLSVLHLYETLGRWRRANYLKLHFAESWNELHHLLIMEELGGNKYFVDRFIAQHIAVFYYFFVVAAYMINPVLAYNLNEAVEEHAYSTYDSFLNDHGEELSKLPPPDVATSYYRDGDLYMFDEMQTTSSHIECSGEPRRPKCDNLFDVFTNIRDDEAEHVKTMNHLQKQEMAVMSMNQLDECVVAAETAGP